MSEPISSPHNPRVAAARKLLDTWKRAAAGLFLVEGPHGVGEALGSPRHDIDSLFVTAGAARRERLLMRAAAERDVPVLVVTDRVLATLSDTVTPQGVIAVVREPAADAAPVISRKARLVVVLHDVRDPGNIGTVIRTADAAGADAVLLTGDSADPHNPKTVRASAGSVFHLPVVRRRDALETIASLHGAGLVVVATTVAADAALDEVADDRLKQPTAWLFGNEAHGLAAEIEAAADYRLRIPIYGRAESLNIAAAAAVCLYASAAAQRR